MEVLAYNQSNTMCKPAMVAVQPKIELLSYYTPLSWNHQWYNVAVQPKMELLSYIDHRALYGEGPRSQSNL